MAYCRANIIMLYGIVWGYQGRIQDLRKGGSYSTSCPRKVRARSSLGAQRRNFFGHAPLKVPRPLINPHVLPHDL